MDEESEAIINMILDSKEPVPYAILSKKCKNKKRFYAVLGKLDFYGFLIYEENGTKNRYGLAGVRESSRAEKYLRRI